MNPEDFKLGALVRAVFFPAVFFPAGYFDRTEMIGVVVEKTLTHLRVVGFFQSDGSGEQINPECQSIWFTWDSLVPMNSRQETYSHIFIEVIG